MNLAFEKTTRAGRTTTLPVALAAAVLLTFTGFAEVKKKGGKGPRDRSGREAGVMRTPISSSE